MVSTTKVKPDPLLPSETESSPDMDFPSHVRTYNRFVRLTAWFVFHLAVLLVALYFAVIQGNWGLGLALVIAAIGVLIFGTMRQKPIRRDFESGLTLSPGARDEVANTR